MSGADRLTTAEVTELNREYTFYDWSAQDTVKAVAVDYAEGSYLIDHDGRRILDLNAQLMNVNLGHQHPTVVAAIKAQADKLCYVNPRFATQPRGELGRELAQISPGALCKSFFTLGGSEATDHAIKIAKLATGKQKIVARRRSYHGATYGAITLTGEARRWATEPGVPGVVRAADPYQYRCRFCVGQERCDQRCADDIDEVIRVEGPGFDSRRCPFLMIFVMILLQLSLNLLLARTASSSHPMAICSAFERSVQNTMSS